MFATSLGQWLGLPMPPVAAIEVSDWLIDNTPELRIEDTRLGYNYRSFLVDEGQRHVPRECPKTICRHTHQAGALLPDDAIAYWVRSANWSEIEAYRKLRLQLIMGGKDVAELGIEGEAVRAKRADRIVEVRSIE
jgi:hypothetical protein